MNILVTGGAGYIGSHTIIELLKYDNKITVVDNLSNSNAESIVRVEKITGKKVEFVQLNLCDRLGVMQLFDSNSFDAVLHFAGLKAVGQSVQKPLEYYSNNIESTLSLCDAMKHHNVRKLIFSSSATVYGTPESLPLTEDSRIGMGITNPYGQTKYMIEQILRDLAIADDSWEITMLRYFNPVGAHESGLIGEDPNGEPNNLLPYVSQVAVGKLDRVNVFGDDYDTPDGTGVRDYIHVVDLAQGHVAALNHLTNGCTVFNLGTGNGVSVLEIIRAFSHVSGRRIPYKIVPRRKGDVASCYADCSKANELLDWKATRSINDACSDTWRWQTDNPDGYTA